MTRDLKGYFDCYNSQYFDCYIRCSILATPNGALFEKMILKLKIIILYFIRKY